MEIRADKEQVGQTVFLLWEGDAALLRRCTVTDPVTRQVYRPGEPDTRFGMPVLMSSQVQNLVWRCRE
jgi:hypothetical protein